MAGYQTGRATLLRTNSQVWLFQQEQVAVGRASMAVQLERISRSSYPWGLSVQIYFTDASGKPADPGACEIDLQMSDIDQDTQYCTAAQFTGGAALNANYVGRAEFLSFYARFARAYVKTLTNSVYVSILATR